LFNVYVGVDGMSIDRARMTIEQAIKKHGERVEKLARFAKWEGV